MPEGIDGNYLLFFQNGGSDSSSVSKIHSLPDELRVFQNHSDQTHVHTSKVTSVSQSAGPALTPLASPGTFLETSWKRPDLCHIDYVIFFFFLMGNNILVLHSVFHQDRI